MTMPALRILCALTASAALALAQKPPVVKLATVLPSGT